MSSPTTSKIYFILVHFGYKWLGPAKTFPTISHFTSYLTYLLRYDFPNHPRMLNPYLNVNEHISKIFPYLVITKVDQNQIYLRRGWT